MKTLLSFLVCLGCTVTAFGQWSIGPKVSYGTITQSTEEIRIIPTSSEIPPQLTFEGGGSVKSIGFMLYNNLGPGFLQLEALGTTYDLQFSSQEQLRSTAQPEVHDERHTILELPVAAGFNVSKFKVGVGPVLEIKLAKDSELSRVDRYEDASRSFNGGFQGLVGYKTGKFVVDLRYVYKFTGIVDGFNIGNDILKLNRSANRLTLSVGMFCGSQKKNDTTPVEMGGLALPMAH